MPNIQSISFVCLKTHNNLEQIAETEYGVIFKTDGVMQGVMQ